MRDRPNPERSTRSSEPSKHTKADRLREACGVFGVVSPTEQVAHLALLGLYALQHRGQESAGIATFDGQLGHCHKAMGLVADVFAPNAALPGRTSLPGRSAIGHTRYSTTGASDLAHSQPHVALAGKLAVAHNGNLINTAQLRKRLVADGCVLESESDSEVITQLLARQADGIEAGLIELLSTARGAYSLTVLAGDAVYGVRDPHGFRPLSIGTLPCGGSVLASETAALDAVGAAYLRDVQPGEVVRIATSGVTTVYHQPETLAPATRALCSFEHVYFARPDSRLEGGEVLVHAVRERLGRALAQLAPVEADLVIAVPDSGRPAARGFATEAALLYADGLVKNHFTGRTFIAPSQALRETAVRLKYAALSDVVAGQRIVLVDDSVVRGTTAQALVRLLRDAGATEVHLRVAAPHIAHPCFMGVDIPTHGELLAHRLPASALPDHLNADSVAFLSLDALMATLGDTAGRLHDHCYGCFSGRYPIDIDPPAL